MRLEFKVRTVSLEVTAKLKVMLWVVWQITVLIMDWKLLWKEILVLK